MKISKKVKFMLPIAVATVMATSASIPFIRNVNAEITVYQVLKISHYLRLQDLIILMQMLVLIQKSLILLGSHNLLERHK